MQITADNFFVWRVKVYNRVFQYIKGPLGQITSHFESTGLYWLRGKFDRIQLCTVAHAVSGFNLGIYEAKVIFAIHNTL